MGPAVRPLQPYLQDAGLPIWEGYSFGLQRTACRICPGQRKIAYAAMRANFPQVWAELLELERRFGPGCWQDPAGEGKGSLLECAGRGEAAFREGNFKNSAPPDRPRFNGRAASNRSLETQGRILSLSYSLGIRSADCPPLCRKFGQGGFLFYPPPQGQLFRARKISHIGTSR